MKLEDLMQEYKECRDTRDMERINKLLCSTVKYIIQNEWEFLLEIIYPFEMDNPTDIQQGSLVIGHAPPEDGFALMIHIPLRDILRGQIDNEEIGQKQKLDYLKKVLPLIPYMN